MNTLEAPVAAVGGVERAADSIAVNVGDVRLLTGVQRLLDRAARCRSVLITQRSRVHVRNFGA